MMTYQFILSYFQYTLPYVSGSSVLPALFVASFQYTLPYGSGSKNYYDSPVNTHTIKVACFQFFRNRITYLPYSS